MRDICTPREIVARARSDDLPLSEYGLRLLLRQGRIPCRRIGTKQLVSYRRVVNFLSCVEGQDNLPLGSGDRRLEAR